MKLKLKTEVILIYFSPRYCNFRQWPLILRGQNVTYSAMFKVGHDIWLVNMKTAQRSFRNFSFFFLRYSLFLNTALFLDTSATKI